MYLPFFLQSSTCRAVLQLLAVQGEYANLTALCDPAPPPCFKNSHITSQSHIPLSGTKHSPTASLSSAQVALNPETSPADLRYTNSAVVADYKDELRTELALNATPHTDAASLESTSDIVQNTSPLADPHPDRACVIGCETKDNLSKDQTLTKHISEEMLN